MSNIPTKFKIGGLEFKVEEVDYIDEGTLYGTFNDVTSTITLACKIKVNDKWYIIPEQNKINTFYHELFHAFHFMWNNETPEDEAQVYANFMTEFEQTKE